MPTEFAEAALRYAGMGLAVIPLEPRDKKPMFNNWPEIATSDKALIGRWWQQNPTANVGIATGQKSRCFVLDVDPKNGGRESYDSLIHQHGQFPDTWQDLTGGNGGGFHLYFRMPSFPVNNAAGLFPGIDIRGTGGQVVAPPSIHPDTGNRYEWDGLRSIEQTPMAEAPPWLLDLLQNRSQRTHSDKFPLSVQIPKGVQHETLVAFAGMMRKLGLSSEEMLPSMLEVNRLRCEQPGAPANIQKIAESMMKYRPSDTDLFSTASRLWRVTKAKEIDKQKEQDKNRVDVVDGLTVYRAQVAEQRCVVEGLLFHGLTVFAGRPKVGKSWLTLQLALSVAHGGAFLGQMPVLRPGRVVYVALEESQPRTAGRMRKLQPHEDVLLQNVSMVYSLSPLMSGGHQQLDELLGNQTPNLVIIDTFLAVVGNAGGKRDVLRSEYAEINAIGKLARKHDTAILLVHHLRKSGVAESGLDAVAGSTGITAAADAIWTMKKEDAGMCSLDVVGRECEEQTIGLRFMQADAVGWSFMGSGEQVKNSKDEKEILMALREEGAMTIGKVAMMLKMNVNRCRALMSAMHQRGMLQRGSSGGYSVSKFDFPQAED